MCVYMLMLKQLVLSMCLCVGVSSCVLVFCSVRVSVHIWLAVRLVVFACVRVFNCFVPCRVVCSCLSVLLSLQHDCCNLCLFISKCCYLYVFLCSVRQQSAYVCRYLDFADISMYLLFVG